MFMTSEDVPPSRVLENELLAEADRRGAEPVHPPTERLGGPTQYQLMWRWSARLLDAYAAQLSECEPARLPEIHRAMREIREQRWQVRYDDDYLAHAVTTTCRARLATLSLP